jgi:dihydrofolate reductase
MRKLIFAINVTIDGYCGHENGLPNEEVHEYFAKLTREAGVLLYGRKTYELMVPFWPDIAKSTADQGKAMKEFADAFVSVPQRVVFSKTLSSTVEKNTTILHTDLRAEVIKLKQEPGDNILTGGVDIPTQLLAEGLIDEIRLVVHPVIAGKGRRLFDGLDLQAQLELKLVETKSFKSGHVVLRYAK